MVAEAWQQRGGGGSGGGGGDDDDDNGGGDEGNTRYCAGGRGCSVYGLNTRNCLLRTVGMPPLEQIRLNCYFADRSVNDMNNGHKRYLLYWWWATNIFCIRGSKNRQQLPDCIVNEIRRLYPSPDQKHTGFVLADHFN